METLRAFVVLIHLVGFAVLFGSWVVSAAGDRKFTRVMSAGLTIAAVAGLALAAPWGLADGQELDHMKIGVKLVILLIIGALIGIGSARAKRGATVPSIMFTLVGLLTLGNAAIAVLWR